MTPHDAAREAVRLAEMATPPPWSLSRDGQTITQTKHVTRDVWTIPHSEGDMPLIAHAGTHYAAIASALLSTAPEIARRDAEIGRLRGLLERAMPCVGYEPIGQLYRSIAAGLRDEIRAALAPEEKTK